MAIGPKQVARTRVAVPHELLPIITFFTQQNKVYVWIKSFKFLVVKEGRTKTKECSLAWCHLNDDLYVPRMRHASVNIYKKMSSEILWPLKWSTQIVIFIPQDLRSVYITLRQIKIIIYTCLLSDHIKMLQREYHTR